MLYMYVGAKISHPKKLFFVPAIIIPILAYARRACQVVIPRRCVYQTARLRPCYSRPHSTAVALLDDIDFGEFETIQSPPSPSLLENNVAVKWDWRRRNQVNSKKEAVARRLGIPAQPLQPEDQWHAEALRYREHFLDLLEHERAQEEAVLRERLSTWSLRRLCEEGYAITDLSAYWVEKKRSQKAPKTISFQLGPGVVLPENRFENGTQVLISRFDPLKEKPVRGSVVSKGTSHLRVGVDNEEFEPDGAWRIDVGGSASVYDRMAHAVKGLGNVPVTGGGDVNEDVICTGTHLADVLLAGFSQENSVPTSTSSPGIFRNDMRIASWAARYMRPKPLVMEGDPPLEGLNDTQRRAMAMMVGERFSLIQGPPGTGKTKTIIETVKLLKGHFAVPHPLLVCTYTNVAVDNLVEGLAAAKLKPLRVAYSGKSKPDLEEHTLEWKVAKHPLAPSTEAISKECDTLTNQVNDLRDFVRVFDDPQGRRKRRLLALERRLQYAIRRLYKQRQKMVQDVLDECDVVCTTCITSAANVLAVADFPVVFLDEASMSTEPASLIPFMKGSCHVSLIGDHKQLPPVITSPEAKALGLGVSLFERLIEEARVPSIMLDTQYRMHPAISAFPSLEFYDLGLRDGIGGQAPLNGMQQSVVFIDHAGPESVRDRSRVNWNEAHIIMNVIEDVLLSNSHLTGHDIGIIAPYAAQISLLNRLLNVDPQYAARFERTLGYQALQLRHIEVKTVDGFEGREKDVIIFSTVRNNSGGHIGFLADRGRLNVGLTRAKRGLFVVGSVDTLRRGKSGYDVEDDGGIKSWRSGGAESWRRYAGYCLKEGLVVKVKKNSLSDSLYGVRS